MLLSVDRALAVRQVQSAPQTMTVAQAIVTAVIIWLVAISFVFPIAIGGLDVTVGSI